LAGWPLGIGPSRRLAPASPFFGLTGQPVDRYYIEDFLEKNAADVSGRVLEVGESRYTVRFGGHRVISSDILHATAENPHATIIADLTAATQVPSESWDCIIFTQTLQMIFDAEAAIATLRRILAPGGVLLASLPGIAPISWYDMERWGDFWRFTSLSARRLFETAFQPSDLQIEAHGSLISATAFLYGLAAEDLDQDELQRRDQDYEVLITVRAIKGGLPGYQNA
jgi:SAM-dependent methyltransferase